MSKIRRRDRGVKKGENQNPNPENQAEANEDVKGDSTAMKILKAVGKGVMYVGIGALTVCGVWAVVGAVAGKKSNSDDESDEDDEEEEDSDESEESEEESEEE